MDRAIGKTQTVLFVVSALSALTSFWAKGVIASDPASAKFIDLPYFVHNFDHAAHSAFVYWASSASFLLSFAVAGLLEKAKAKPRF